MCGCGWGVAEADMVLREVVAGVVSEAARRVAGRKIGYHGIKEATTASSSAGRD